MTGAFSLGEIDPRAGAAVGAATRTKLSMTATVTIPDMDTFVRDPEHLGMLAGTVSFAPLSQPRPSNAGLFKLFSPSGDPELTFMVYELAFEAGGERYYLAGKKEVRRDTAIDLWKDTTTLYARLYQGDSKDGRVLGAGVLHLSVLGLARLVTTMRVTSPSSAVRILATFGGFFAKQLWRTYVTGASEE
jgi:cholesterol oxidase